ncbi:MAG: hypothetical protein U0168_14640 [Nannocystaceae bacterium]
MLWGSPPFVLWDAAVVGRHWWLEPTRVLGPSLLGLPLEELGFFVVAAGVPAHLGAGHPRRSAKLRWLRPWAAIAAAGLDRGGDRRRRRARGHLGGAGRRRAKPVIRSTMPAARESRSRSRPRPRRSWAHDDSTATCPRLIVHYDDGFTTGVRGHRAAEDYGFGLALVLVTTVLYQRARGRTPLPSWPARAIRARPRRLPPAVESAPPQRRRSRTGATHRGDRWRACRAGRSQSCCPGVASR